MFLDSFKYFQCTDEDRCSTLMVIYDSSDNTIYQRARSQMIEECHRASAPAPGVCTVCLCQQNVTIICTNGTEPADMEDSEGRVLSFVNISTVCMYLLGSGSL